MVLTSFYALMATQVGEVSLRKDVARAAWFSPNSGPSYLYLGQWIPSHIRSMLVAVMNAVPGPIITVLKQNMYRNVSETKNATDFGDFANLLHGDSGSCFTAVL